MIDKAAQIIKDAIDQINPTHVISMVSGGKDSAASHQVLKELGVKADLIIHGNTRCGIPETTEFVRDYYGHEGVDYAEADAGTTYEDRVLRKGFYGVGRGAHNYAFRELKARFFRKAISENIRKGRRGFKVLLINGARKDESENRKKTLLPIRQDGDRQDFWVSPIYDWSQEDRDKYLGERQVPINPVAKALCRSGECMCGTMQSKAERVEAAAIYPGWGKKMDDLEAEAIRLHGFGWGDDFPKPMKELPMDNLMGIVCADCTRGKI
jgi:3'-phosphoadenosine 5'-phosphosulfate sulfotransferase (PAPS reductase)/FAD synthetase